VTERHDAGAGSVVWVDGLCVDPGDAALSVFDHGFTVGDGVFETVLVAAGVPVALEPHLVRLAATTAVLGIELGVGAEELVAVCTESAARFDALGAGVRGRLRITVSSGVGPSGALRGPGPATVVVTCDAAPPVAASV